MKKEVKVLFLILFYFIYNNFQEALAGKKFCEIKFNVNVGEKILEKKLNIKFNSKFVTEKYDFNCYQIGVEHDKRENPIKEKPIFACCHNI